MIVFREEIYFENKDDTGISVFSFCFLGMIAILVLVDLILFVKVDIDKKVEHKKNGDAILDKINMKYIKKEMERIFPTDSVLWKVIVTGDDFQICYQYKERGMVLLKVSRSGR